jgi:hypothetical protein
VLSAVLKNAVTVFFYVAGVLAILMAVDARLVAAFSCFAVAFALFWLDRWLWTLERESERDITQKETSDA